jgi:hypothetical protein
MNDLHGDGSFPNLFIITGLESDVKKGSDRGADVRKAAALAIKQKNKYNKNVFRIRDPGSGFRMTASAEQ